LPLAVAAFALEFKSIKVEGQGDGSFVVRAWNRLKK
jgi:hypothetical protein